MNCAVTSCVDAAAWDRLVSESGSASFFQSRLWSGLLARALPEHEPLFVTGEQDGELVAGIPAMRRKRGPVSVVESMPFGTYGGLLTTSRAPANAGVVLVEELRRGVGGPTVGQLRIVDFEGRLADACAGFATEQAEAQVVDLDRPFSEVWDGFRPSARNKVRKAEKAGVTVRVATTVDDFLAYHEMLEECSERWDAPNPFGPHFFKALADSGSTQVQMLLAEHDGTIIAGDLNFLSANSVFNWGNVSHRDAVRLAPNSLLHARGMEIGCERGLMTYNLGGSGGIEAVAKFKSAFGTRPRPYTEYVLEKPWMKLGKALRGRGGGGAS